jgi:hypothetical protein
MLSPQQGREHAADIQDMLVCARRNSMPPNTIAKMVAAMI